MEKKGEKADRESKKKGQAHMRESVESAHAMPWKDKA